MLYSIELRSRIEGGKIRFKGKHPKYNFKFFLSIKSRKLYRIKSKKSFAKHYKATTKAGILI
jgi:hypothetical protein